MSTSYDDEIAEKLGRLVLKERIMKQYGITSEEYDEDERMCKTATEIVERAELRKLKSGYDALVKGKTSEATPSAYNIGFMLGKSASEESMEKIINDKLLDPISFQRGDEKKRDHGKPMWDLLPMDAISGIVDVLTFGAQKYGPNSWKTVDNATERYYAAMMRHIVAWRSGETLDKESGLPHLSHAACCLVFIMWLSKQEKVETEK